MGGIKPTFRQRNPRRSLAGLQRLWSGKIIQPAPGMGLDITQRFVLACEVIQHPRQKRVFVDVGQIASMVKVLVGQHGCELAKMGFSRKFPADFGRDCWLKPQSCELT